MSLSAEITALEAEFRRLGVPIDTVLSRAGVNRSTWTRWKNGSVAGARYDTFQKVKSAAADLAAANDAGLEGDATDEDLEVRQRAA